VPLNSYRTVPAETDAGQTAPAPLAPGSFSAAEYRISPLDQLRIDVFDEPELSVTELPVDPNGRIVLPLVGEIVAQGLTPAELAAEIAASLRSYLREPAVAVNVTTFTSRNVTVDGAVRLPGVYPAVGDLSLMDTIALGQGLNDYSEEDEVMVFRRQNGQRYVARFDLGPIRNGQAVDPAILPGDIVVVGESASRRFFTDSLAVLPAAVGIFIALIQ